MIFIYDLGNDRLAEVKIELAFGLMPTKDDGWSFDWNKLVKEKNTKTYVLKLKGGANSVEGILQLRMEHDLLIMDVIELAPHNIGSADKKFDDVAGCLIAFACRESFKIDGHYKGFLSFTSKTNLIDWYKEKYGATQALGQRMYIDDVMGKQLIQKYLNNE